MPKLNRNVRFLVLNRTNQAVRPKDENIPGQTAAELKAAGKIGKKYSPSFLTEQSAKEFGAALAAKYPGERFYLVKVIAGCMVEPATGPWVATGTAVADETLAADLDGEGGLDDADDNE